VSKEFVCARDDERGVLVLSTFAGAAHELQDALIVNPYDFAEVATALISAVEMPIREQRRRMRRMRTVVSRADATRWAEDLLASVAGSERLIARPDRTAFGRALGQPISSPRPLVASDASAF
jgi:trehalose 6-phosphate synthase